MDVQEPCRLVRSGKRQDVAALQFVGPYSTQVHSDPRSRWHLFDRF